MKTGMVASVGRQPARGLTPASLYSRAVSVCRGVSSQGVSSPGVSSQGVYSPGVNSQDFPAQAFSPTLSSVPPPATAPARRRTAPAAPLRAAVVPVLPPRTEPAHGRTVLSEGRVIRRRRLGCTGGMLPTRAKGTQSDAALGGCSGGP